MDVSFGETLTEFPKELIILIPFIVVSHMWQFYMGVQMIYTCFFVMKPFHTHWTDYTEEVQCFICGMVAVFLGIGNIVTTATALMAKARRTRLNQKKVE